MLRAITALILLTIPSALCAERSDTASGTIQPEIKQRVTQLLATETTLNSVRPNIPECETGCVTPAEAVALAYEAGEGQPVPGRFLLDVLGGGRSLHGELGELFFINSQLGYGRFGTLTIAFTEDALWDLLRRARACGGGERDGRIEVLGCHRSAKADDLNMFTMMQRLGNRRIVVDGEVRLQWIDAATGAPRPVANIRGEREPGYYQVWVRVQDADQVIFVYDD